MDDKSKMKTLYRGAKKNPKPTTSPTKNNHFRENIKHKEDCLLKMEISKT